jgi:hypothetical protein
MRRLRTTVVPQPTPKENYLVLVLSLAFVAGMAVAIGVYLAWSRGVLPPAFQGASSLVALFFCPPFILSIAVGPTANADLVLVLIVGTIVFANGFLYAGVAAGLYHLVTLMRKTRRA